MIYAVHILIAFSVFFALAGVVGMLRMPDAFCRMQSSTNVATFGVLGVIIGGILYSLGCYETPNWTFAIKLFCLGVFYIVTNPIAGHAIAKAGYHHGVETVDMVCDKYGEDME